MNIFFTGATGVIGRQTVPLLTAAGHDVAAAARTAEDHAWVRDVDATPVTVDLFDPTAVHEATAGADVVVHMATAIPRQTEMTKRRSWTMNDRLRAEATRNLVDAALAHGVGRFIQQSITFVYADGGDRWLDEDAPVETAWDVLDSALEAERQVQRFAREGGAGVALRLSALYGPGPVSGEYVATVSARKLPIIGKGDNYVSHLHVTDSASAIVAALQAPAGIYNVSDDKPVTKRRELESLASAMEVAAPRIIPKWVAKTVVGSATTLLTISQRVSNTRFKETTGWAPAYPSVTAGWDSFVRPTSTVG